MRFPARISFLAAVVVMLAGVVAISSNSATAGSGDIGGEAEIYDVNLLDDLIDDGYGHVTVPPSGGTTGGTLAPIGLEAEGVGVDGVLTIDAPLTAATVWTECEGDPGAGGVLAHCESGVEDLGMSLALSLLDESVLDIPILAADTIIADATSTGTGSTLESSADGSTVAGLVIDEEAIDVDDHTVVPVDTTVSISGDTTLNTEDALDDLNLGELGSEVDDLVQLIDELLTAEDEGLLVELTNTLGIDATIGITGDVVLLEVDQSGNGSTSTGVDVVAIATDLTVTADLELGLVSDIELAVCTDFLSGVTCLLDNLLGELLGVVDDILGTDSLLGGILEDLGIGFGDEGTIEDDTLVELELGVLSTELVTASSEITGYQAPPDAPTISSVNPGEGPASGGTTVTITGDNFAGANDVQFGNESAATFNVDSDSQITATTPAHNPGTIDVTVTTPAGTSGPGSFTFIDGTPVIDNVSPDEGPASGGTTVTITGDNFVSGCTVTFGGEDAASVTVESSTEITAVTPAHEPATVDVVVSCPAGDSNAEPFTFFDDTTPVIFGVDPNLGPSSGGTEVTITGDNFDGATAVHFGDEPAASFTVDSDSQITATTPPHEPATVMVSVTTGEGTSESTSAGNFTFYDDTDEGTPIVASVDPDEGPASGGTQVTISGVNLDGAESVTFGNTPAAEFTVIDDGEIFATSPAHSPGTVNVVVTTPGGSSPESSANEFTFFDDTPVIDNIDPDQGPPEGGTDVVITGDNFNDACTVTFGGIEAESATVDSNTQISVVTPSHEPGTVDVVVSCPVGDSPPGSFTYTDEDDEEAEYGYVVPALAKQVAR